MTPDPGCEPVFACQLCGDCCRGYGGTYVTESDIQAIADYLHEDPKRFKSKYCQLSGSRYVLAQADNGYCIFWDKLCRIHPVKPRMCLKWPYLSAVLADIYMFIDSQGVLHFTNAPTSSQYTLYIKERPKPAAATKKSQASCNSSTAHRSILSQT